MDVHSLQVILQKHKAWLNDEDGGERADLRAANLRGADLSYADLSDADLSYADLSDLQKVKTQIVPQSGTFIAYKKLRGGIAKLEIPESAKRSNAPGGRKCRASKAKVLSFIGSHEKELRSIWSNTFIYRVGETVVPKDPFCEDWTQECASGIHFYLSLEEAEAHQ